MITHEEMQHIIDSKISLARHLGVKIAALNPRHCKLQMPLKGNENHIGTVYAGAIFTLAEIPGGVLCWVSFDMSKFFPVIKEMNLKFIKPAQTDITIELSLSQEEAEVIETQALEQGKSEFVLEGEIRDENGQVVALSKGVYQLRAQAKINSQTAIS
jgi:thioesterase domain-containing protein